MMKPRDLARAIDHSCFRPDATPSDIQKLCEEAVEYGFRAVCVNSAFVWQCARLMKRSNIPVASAVGFPLGTCSTDVKLFECKRALEDGAREIEVAMALGQLKGSNYTLVEKELDAVVRVASGHPVRAIIDVVLLTNEELVLACKIAKNVGVSGIKTSTGFGGGKASIDQVKLVRQTVGATLTVKASGGIRTYNEAELLLQAGASTIGTSSGPRMITAHETGPGTER